MSEKPTSSQERVLRIKRLLDTRREALGSRDALGQKAAAAQLKEAILPVHSEETAKATVVEAPPASRTELEAALLRQHEVFLEKADPRRHLGQTVPSRSQVEIALEAFRQADGSDGRPEHI